VGYEVVAIGASWGGLRALRIVLGALPAEFAAAVVVAQHRAPDGDDTMLLTLLDAATPLPVREATDRAPLVPGEVLLAPPGYHLLVEPGEVALSCDAHVQFSRPSVDVLFESLADAYGERAGGVILTGANEDGAAGLAAIRRRGGMVLVQDPQDAERPEMPMAALAACPARRLPVAKIGPALAALVGTREVRA
jgi:two-component system, chemotaxis family, protein-glutamate methylesterase/glutaminase